MTETDCGRTCRPCAMCSYPRRPPLDRSILPPALDTPSLLDPSLSPLLFVVVQCQFFFLQTVSSIFQKFRPVIVPFSYKSLQFDVPVVIELDPGAKANQIDLLTPTIAFMSPSMTYVQNSSFVSIVCLLENRFSLSITFLSRPKVGGLDAWTCVITGHTIVFV